jgi:hypothetical protein
MSRMRGNRREEPLPRLDLFGARRFFYCYVQVFKLPLDLVRFEPV